MKDLSIGEGIGEMKFFQLGPCLISWHFCFFQVLGPPHLQTLQGQHSITTELGQDFHSCRGKEFWYLVEAYVLLSSNKMKPKPTCDGTDIFDSLCVVAARQHRQQDHFLSGKSEVLGNLCHGKCLAVLFPLEKVLVNGFTPEHPDIRVIGDGSMAEI